jgi:hypothetical protein
LNSNYRIQIILLLNLVKLLQISKVQTIYEFELNKSDGKIINNTVQPGSVHSALGPPSRNGPAHQSLLTQQTETGDLIPPFTNVAPSADSG